MVPLARAVVTIRPLTCADGLSASAELRAAGAGDAVTTLLAGDPAAHASLGDPLAVISLLEALHAAGAADSVTALATRAGNAYMYDLFLYFCPDEAARYPFGREPDGTPSHPWKWQEPAS